MVEATSFIIIYYMSNKKILLVVPLLLFTLCMYAQQATPSITDPRLTIRLPDVNGDTLSLADNKGKVVLVDFWASWCVPCRVANRHLVKMYAKYKEKGFEIFSISLDESTKEWQKAITKDKISWLQVNENTGWEAGAAMRWNITALPATFLVNKKGDVVAIDISGKQLEKAVKKLLKE